ncbi:Methylated-DNA--protein-cysteine methyltransferase [termite gut metagenome]|uniref:Methylated-DNA--protein-cysteine methyltransferase n=1 Tax=termite gut metagenome TaxID=433724 RepID=A0A5J4SSG5_9ZZZZ
MKEIHYYQSPVGCLAIGVEEGALTSLQFSNEKASAERPVHPLLQETCKQLDEYFAGKRSVFELPLAFEGTAFQQKVWKELQLIPFGQTISYAQLAQAVGNPKACRAVGSANGRNPIAIIVPCHRVINANGGLGGYAYGLEVKSRLLKLEREGV